MAEAVEWEWSGLGELRDELAAFVRRRCRDVNEADDVVQETLLRAARYRSRLSSDARLLGWTVRIAANLIADRARRRRRTAARHEGGAPLEAIACPHEVEDETVEVVCDRWVLEQDHALALISSELRGLRGEDRRLLVSFYASDAGCAEVARTCELPERVVKARLYRARQRLLRALRVRMSTAGAGVRHRGEVSRAS